MRQAVISSVRWTALAALASRLLAFLSILVVAKELGPAAFGLLAIVLLSTEIIGLFAEAGFSSAIIQASELTQRQRATIYSLEWMFGAAAVIVMAGLAPIIAIALDISDLTPLLVVAACSILIESGTRQIAAMLQRKMQFNRLVSAELARDFTRAILAMVLVFYFGVWGVVIAHIAGSIIFVLILSTYGMRDNLFPGFALAIREAQPLLAFGAYRAGTVILNRIGQRADQAVVAATLSPNVLGMYRMATQLTGSTLIMLQSITSRVSFSVYSRQQYDPDLALSSFLRLIAAQSFVAAPVAASLVVLADPIVKLILGPDWSSASTLIGFLALFFFFRMFEGAAVPLVNGVGKSKRLMIWSVGSSSTYVVALVVVATNQSAEQIAATMLGVQMMALVLFYLIMLRPIFGPFAWRYIRAVGPSILCASVAAPALFLVHVPVSVPLILSLSLTLVAYAGIYGLMSSRLNRQPFSLLLEAVLPVIRRRRGPKNNHEQG